MPEGLDIGFYRNTEIYVYYQGDINGDGIDDYVLVPDQDYREYLDTLEDVSDDDRKGLLRAVFLFGSHLGIEYTRFMTPMEFWTDSGEEITSYDYFQVVANVFGEYAWNPKEVGRFNVDLANEFDSLNVPDVLQISIGVYAENDDDWTRYSLDELTVIDKPFPERVRSAAFNTQYRAKEKVKAADAWLKSTGQQLKQKLGI